MGLVGGPRAVVTSVPVACVCVYRYRNSAYVRTLMRQLPRARVALHALDSVHPDLAKWTISDGAGQRMPLLNRLIETLDPRDDEYICIADDDVTFIPDGRESPFIGIAASAGLDIFQPAHAWGSHATFGITRHEPLSVVRLTRFVESGPLTVFSPRVRSQVLPFASRFRMGWGADIAWSRLVDQGFRLGVVDATPIVHHEKVGAGYSNDAEAALERREATESGVATAHDVATNVGLTWRPWQKVPKWLDRDSSDSS